MYLNPTPKDKVMSNSVLDGAYIKRNKNTLIHYMIQNDEFDRIASYI